MDYGQYGPYAGAVERFMGHISGAGSYPALDTDPRALVDGLPAVTAIHYEPPVSPDQDPTLFIWGHNSGEWHPIDPQQAMFMTNGLPIAEMNHKPMATPGVPGWEEQYAVSTLFGAEITTDH